MIQDIGCLSWAMQQPCMLSMGKHVRLLFAVFIPAIEHLFLSWRQVAVNNVAEAYISTVSSKWRIQSSKLGRNLMIKKYAFHYVMRPSQKEALLRSRQTSGIIITKQCLHMVDSQLWKQKARIPQKQLVPHNRTWDAVELPQHEWFVPDQQ